MSTPALHSEPVRILLAEDNPGDVRLIREALKVHGIDFELQVVDDGEEALRLIALLEEPTAVRPDLIMLDLNMPKSDGRDILRCIKQLPGVRRIPVVVLSSSDSPLDRAETKRLGADMFIRKPSELDEFMQIGAIAKTLVPVR